MLYEHNSRGKTDWLRLIFRGESDSSILGILKYVPRGSRGDAASGCSVYNLLDYYPYDRTGDIGFRVVRR